MCYALDQSGKGQVSKTIFHLSTIGGYNVYWEIQCVSDPPVVHAIKYSNQILTKYSVMQFQLTINLVALVVAFVAAVTTGEMPLNVLQLLWVNLIMDALAALGDTSLPMHFLVLLWYLFISLCSIVLRLSKSTWSNSSESVQRRKRSSRWEWTSC